MTDNNTRDTTDDSARADGGESSNERRASSEPRSDGGTTQAPQRHQNTDYLDEEVNLLKPSTPYMRDHLRIVWAGFVAWALIVFGPVTLTAIAPGVMTTTMPVLGFPWHYFLVGFGAPTGALILAAVYARQRDKLDDKYGIDHSTAGPGESETSESGEATATDGGEPRADGGTER
jgi:putative solute:sodium symporter small subunit